jgi:hypothetical protein
LTVTDFPWTGEYFNGVPVTIVAQPSPGYRFVGWEGSITSNDPQISLVFSGDAGLTALFEPYSPDSLVINEINYNSADDFNPEDWIEFYNPMDQPVDMTGWYFKDEDNAHIFNFPEGLIVASHDYLVLCFDTTAFHSFFPDVTCAIGNNGFGLSGGGDQLRLFDPSGLLIDSVFYDDDLPWPIEADGQGPTLELIDPSYNNALAENWEASELHGSPGVTNGIPTQLNESNPFETEIQVVPNPFGKTVTFVFHSPVEQAIDITIFNHMGELFMQFKNVNLPLGTGLYTWDGRDISGKPVPPGLYLCRISSRDFSTTVKLIKGE